MRPFLRLIWVLTIHRIHMHQAQIPLRSFRRTSCTRHQIPIPQTKPTNLRIRNINILLTRRIINRPQETKIRPRNIKHTLDIHKALAHLLRPQDSHNQLFLIHLTIIRDLISLRILVNFLQSHSLQTMQLHVFLLII